MQLLSTNKTIDDNPPAIMSVDDKKNHAGSRIKLTRGPLFPIIVGSMSEPVRDFSGVVVPYIFDSVIYRDRSISKSFVQLEPARY